MKPTPRTDALITGIYDDGLGLEYEANALADFARTLERELSDALDGLARVRAEEREACAKVCEQMGRHRSYDRADVFQEAAAAIRTTSG